MSKTRITGTAATLAAARIHRRTLLKGATAAAAVGIFSLRAQAVLGQAKPFAGVTITGASFQSVFNELLKGYIPEFEEMTGMRVDFQQQAFPVYDQRMDLELSTQGSAYDFCNLTFVYSGRWVGAGWFHPLNEMLDDSNLTSPEFDAADFVPGTMAPLMGANGEIYALPWEAGAMLMGIARSDLLDEAGLKMPTTFEELAQVCQAVNRKDGVAAYVNDKLHHWHYPSFLMGFGGNVFRAPPEDLMPTLDTAEAAEAAEYYARLLSEFGPPGVLSFTDDQAMRAQLAGRANIRTQAVLWLSPLATNPESKVASTVRYALMPGGPKGAFPGSNSHGLGIPAGAKNKEAAWAFIQWALSKDLLRRMVSEKGYSAVCRRSLIESADYKARMTLNGHDVASLYLQVLELGGKSGFMKYRTVPVFPQVGDKINKAIERIASGQQNARESMRQAQDEAVADLKKAGVL